MRLKPIKTKIKADYLDVLIGNNLKKFRKLRGMPLVGLAKELDISFQQLQKYENGTNKISANAILKLSRVLDFNPSDFYTGLTLESKLNKSDQELAELNKCFLRIEDKETRGMIISLIKKLSRQSEFK